MRGGRNKFGPMYKRDRALKQQRNALIQASGIKIGCSPAFTTHQRDFTSGLLPFPTLHSTSCGRSTGAASGIDSYRLYSRPFSPQGLIMPHLVMEFLRCDQEELKLKNKVTARLLQEQKDWENLRNPYTFSLLCFMADQTLFSIVEWARTSMFFKQLQVRSYLIPSYLNLV